jgi:cellulose synthase/poly-beta-1,6-N-acetylglucosamine synthase-like glycosyltransferase
LTERGFAEYDVLAAIDPDHVPETSFLMETLGQLSDPSVAYVQSPQEYYNLPASFIARGCSEESRDYYWITQRAYHRFRSPSVIGCHGVHRMEVLKAIGGLAPHIADDLLLTLQYQMSGWKGAYVPKVLAKGLAPVDWPTYLKQQRRWASSLFDVKFRIYPRMTRAMPLSTRVVGFLQGLTYFQDAAAAVCCAIALCAVLMTGLPESFASAATAPAFLIGASILLVTGVYPHLYHGSHRNLTFYWRAAWLRLVKWPYTLLALSSLIRRHDRGYELTTKGNQPSTIDWALYWPHLLICAIVFAAWAFGMSRGSTGGLLPHLLAVLAVLPSLMLIASSLLEAPAAFDPVLADRHIDDARS